MDPELSLSLSHTKADVERASAVPADESESGRNETIVCIDTSFHS